MTERNKTIKRAKEFAEEWNLLLAKDIKVGKIQVDEQTNTEYLPLILQMDFVYRGFIERFIKATGLRFFGIMYRRKRINLLFSRGDGLTI